MKKTINHALSLFKAAVSALPWVGGSIASLIGDYIPSSTQDFEARAFNNFNEVVEKQNRAIKNDVALEIDQNLQLLRDFWDTFQRFQMAPSAITQALYNVARIVVDPTIMKTIPREFRVDLSRWHHEILEKQTSLVSLSEKEAKNVRQFHYKLDTITSMYEELRSLGKSNDDAMRRSELRDQWENIITEVLQQGNPIKTT